jgi:CRISPR-associated protein Csy1
VACLLPSLPPALKKRTIKKPKVSFFNDILWAKNYTEEFKAFHKLLISDGKNFHISNKRDYLLRNIIYQVVDQAWVIRRLDNGWSDSELCQALPKSQKIWLDQQHQILREENEEWYGPIKSELSLWLLKAYRSVIGDKEVGLGDDQLPYFKSIIDQCKEALV